jgi:hypothetical protein
MKIKATISYVDLENDRGYDVEGVRVTCERCGHETESFGTSQASIKRCLVLLREECPEREKNFYVQGETKEAAEEMSATSPCPDEKIASEMITAGKKSLCRKYHPDTGGSTEKMVAVNLVAEWFRLHLKDGAS